MGKLNVLYLEDAFAEDRIQTGFPGGTMAKNRPANPEMQETRVWSLGGEDLK